MNKTYLTLVMLLVAISAQAQDLVEKRIEIERDRKVEILRCQPAGQQGLILTLQNDLLEQSRKEKTFTFAKYNTELEAGDSANVVLPNGDNYYQNVSDGHLFRMGCRKEQYTIAYLNIDNMRLQTISGVLPKKSTIFHAEGVNDEFYIAATAKEEPYVVMRNCNTQAESTVFLKSDYPKKSAFINLETDSASGEAYVFVKEYDKTENYYLSLYIFKHGQMVNKYELRYKDDGKYIANASVSRMSDGSYLLSGTYNDKPSMSSDKSIGVYIAKIENGALAFSKFVNYLDIKNYTSYASEWKQKQIEKKKEKKAKKGEEYTLHYLMAPHAIIEQNGQYLLAGEAYFPTYTTQYIHVPGPNGTTMTQTIQLFDGYVYSHYFLIGFDHQGEVLWTNAAPLKTAKSWYVHTHLSINLQDSRTEVIYPSHDFVEKRRYQNGEEIEHNEIPYVAEGQKLRYAFFSYFENEYWYGPYFLSFGYEKVKEEDSNKKRRLYFINKVNCSK